RSGCTSPVKESEELVGDVEPWVDSVVPGQLLAGLDVAQGVDAQYPAFDVGLNLAVGLERVVEQARVAEGEGVDVRRIVPFKGVVRENRCTVEAVALLHGDDGAGFDELAALDGAGGDDPAAFSVDGHELEA